MNQKPNLNQTNISWREVPVIQATQWYTGYTCLMGASCEGSFFHCTTAPAPFPSKHLRLCGHPDFFQLLRWPVQRSCEELKIEIKSIKIDRFRCSYLFLGTTFTVASQDAPAAREMGSHSTLSTSKNWSSTNFYQFLLRSVSLFSSAT